MLAHKVYIGKVIKRRKTNSWNSWRCDSFTAISSGFKFGSPINKMSRDIVRTNANVSKFGFFLTSSSHFISSLCLQGSEAQVPGLCFMVLIFPPSLVVKELEPRCFCTPKRYFPLKTWITRQVEPVVPVSCWRH